MVNWQVFKVEIKETWQSSELSPGLDRRKYDLDNYVEFADGYEKTITVKGFWGLGYYQCGGYASAAAAREEKFIEIDLDKTKLRNHGHIFEKDVWKKVPEEVVVRRRMEAAASVDPTALFVTRDGIDRINRGEISEFEYKMVDNSNNTHHFIYRK